MRNLEREIGTICRKQARRIAEGTREKMEVTPELVEKDLGAPRFRTDTEVAERTRRPGVAVGLAWTPVGGDVLFIEAGRMPGGNKGLIMTGQLGPVMQESVQAALTWVRGNATQYGIDPDLFKTSDIHIHVPAGAIPKDGPSAGITMATALLSMLTDRRVRANLAMTGEITLTGQVLPVGGIKEKVLAAKRSGVREVILPVRKRSQRARGSEERADRRDETPLREGDGRSRGTGARTAGEVGRLTSQRAGQQFARRAAQGAVHQVGERRVVGIDLDHPGAALFGERHQAGGRIDHRRTCRSPGRPRRTRRHARPLSSCRRAAVRRTRPLRDAPARRRRSAAEAWAAAARRSGQLAPHTVQRMRQISPCSLSWRPLPARSCRPSTFCVIRV